MGFIAVYAPDDNGDIPPRAIIKGPGILKLSGRTGDAGGDLTSQQTLYGGRRTLKGNVEILKVRSPGQHDAEEMKGRTRARRSIGGLIGIASAPGNEISKCLHRAGDHRTNRKQHGRGGDGGNRGEILLRIVTERLVDVRVKSHRYGRRQDHDRPVRRAVLQNIHHDATARTRTVLDDRRRRIRLHLLGKESRDNVAGAARGEADHDARRRVQWLRQTWRESQGIRRNTARAPKKETPAIGPHHATNVSHCDPPAVIPRRATFHRQNRTDGTIDAHSPEGGTSASKATGEDAS